MGFLNKILPVLILLPVTIFFILLSFLPQQTTTPYTNILSLYYAQVLGFATQYRLFVALFFIVLLFLSIKSYKGSFIAKYFLHPIHTGFVVAVGFFLAFLLLFGIAFLQLNIVSFLINTNPKALGMQHETNDILNTIKADTTPLLVVPVKKDSVLAAIAAATTGTDSVYGGAVLSTVPQDIVLPTDALQANMLLFDRTLIVTHITSYDMHLISPMLAYGLVKNYFPDKKVKSYPIVVAMEQEEYQSYRGAEMQKRLTKIDNELGRLDAALSSISASIIEDREKIALNEEFVKEGPSQRDAEYKACIASKQYSQVECRSMRMKWYEAIAQGKKNITDWNKKLEADQKGLQKYQYYAGLLTRQKELAQVNKEKLTNEFGVFQIPNSIRILLSSSDSSAMPYYMSTLIHEYLHYTSYLSEEKIFETTFFEEGLTEYFARQIIRQSLREDVDLGYPAHIKIISEIATKIPQKELVDIYFAKDERRLAALLDKAYGKDFYANTRILFQTLHFSSDQQESTVLTQEILSRMNTQPPLQ